MTYARFRPAAAATLALAATLTLASCGGKTRVDWAIVESAPGGEVLRVIVVSPLAPCNGTPTIDLRKSNANRVEVAVLVENPSDCDTAGVQAKPIDVELAQPLRGQQITGPRMQPPTAYAGARSATTIPSVVGFRVPDARAILRAHGLEVGRIFGPAIDATEVTSQSPPPGTALPTDSGSARPKVSLRTVPR